MRVIKFRQYITDMKTWHYWGFMSDGSFTGPVNLHDPSDEFTGLKDKNGVEIYEGDVVRWDKWLFRVEWQEPSFEFVCSDEYAPIQDGWNVAESSEVIGNTHSNPGLVADLAR